MGCGTRILTGCAIGLALAACGPSPPTVVESTRPPAERAGADALDRATAQRRKARLSEVRYRLRIDLTESAEAFSGQALVDFMLTDNDGPLTIDLSGAQIEAVALNGQPLEPAYNDYFLTLPAAELRSGANQLQVTYRHRYDGDGTGLHRFVDPEDGRTYLFTYLWPYYANRMFPAFDQPDLKAIFELVVLAPESWTVVSAAPGAMTAEEAGTATWAFEPTPRLSTYVFSLHAGPYAVWEDRAGDVPLRLMARQSLAPHVDVDEWFAVTRAGLDFFAQYFEIPYPFAKYDQLIVPDFNIGAMENVAAVTFNERYVQRGPSDRFEREARAEVILHEMAHMWFGNLVTKQWWDGLWLNESFATLMAYFALAAATEFDDTWHGFFVNDKQRAYFKDSRVTTHPIQVPVPSTADFFSVFDAITYQKGSSVLKQLAFFVGPENFRSGVAAYLARHAWGNTVLADFIRAVGEAAGRDLDGWARDWLYTAGFNELGAQAKCEDGRMTEATITQTAPEAYPVLRSHRVRLAFYGVAEGLQRLGTMDGMLGGAATRLQIDEPMPCPALVFPNHEDWTYAQVRLDDAALAALADGRIGTLGDPLARSMLLQSLLDMAMDGRLSLASYVEMALDQAQEEANLRVLAQLTRSLAEVHGLLQRLRPESNGTRRALQPNLEAVAWQQVSTVADEDRARLWFDLWLQVGRFDVTIDRFRQLLAETLELPGMKLGPEQRWELVIALARRGIDDAEALVSAEAQRDPSDRGEKLAIAADAARPTPAVKSRWLAALADSTGDLGLAEARYAIADLFPADQTDLQADQLDIILGSLAELGDRDPYFLASYVQGLLQPICTQASTAALAAALKAGGYHPTVELFLREAHQADAECLELRETMPQPAPP